MTYRPHYLSALFVGTALLTSACSVAPPMNPQEEQIQTDLAVDRYMPATREMRDAIETQELFAQAAFWSNEYHINPSDLEAAIKLSAAVRKLGNPGRAVEITQTTRALYPRDPYLTAEFAAALIASERANDAMQPLNDALSQASGYGRLWSLKGAALDQMERYGEARQHYARAMQITPNDPNVLANLGLSYALAGDAATAEGWLRRAAAQPGASATVRQNLALVLQLQGKTAEADRLLGNSPAPQRFPTSTPLNNPIQRETVLQPPTVRQTAPQAAARSAPATSQFASGRALREAQANANRPGQMRQQFAPQAVQPTAGQSRMAGAPIPAQARPQAQPQAQIQGQPLQLGRVADPASGAPIATSPQAQQEMLNRIAQSLQPARQQRMPTTSLQNQRPPQAMPQAPSQRSAPAAYPQPQGYAPQIAPPSAQPQRSAPEPRGRSRRRR